MLEVLTMPLQKRPDKGHMQECYSPKLTAKANKHISASPGGIQPPPWVILKIKGPAKEYDFSSSSGRIDVP